MAALRARIVYLGQLIGFIAPFKPAVIPTPPGQASAKPLAVKAVVQLQAGDALDGIITGAESFLRGLDILNPASEDIMKLLGVKVSESFGSNQQIGFFTRFRDQLVESISKGETIKEWQQRSARIADISRSQDEQIYRTTTRRAYNSGFRSVLDGPAGDIFEYRQFFVTIDGRQRETHEELHEKVYHRDSATAAIAKKRLDEHQCRCTEVAMTRESAEAIGIDDDIQGVTQEAATAGLDQPV